MAIVQDMSDDRTRYRVALLPPCPRRSETRACSGTRQEFRPLGVRERELDHSRLAESLDDFRYSSNPTQGSAERRSASSFVLAVIVLITVGCASNAPFTPAGLPADGVVMMANPTQLPPGDTEFLWNQIVDTLDDYFKIEREERVRIVGGVLTEGRIETYPVSGATLLEPWHGDSVGPYERLHATLQSIRRRAVVRVMPIQSGYSVEVAVFKELEDVDRPEHATVGSSTFRHDGTIVRADMTAERDNMTLGWIPQGRDAALEQRILADLHGRILGAGQPNHPPHSSPLGLN